MSLDALRSQVLSNAAAEERVEVNQRHLIDKILARYSAEFVVFRELMQNADDAKSTSVQIVFETKKASNSSTKLNLKDKYVRILFKNNGFEFRPEDWNRLKKIAEGNPDEQKIGAFGVGFYSLFSVCEEPFVASGGQGMAFYWRGDQLFAKRAPTNQADKVWTTFLMDARDPAELPNIEHFGRFLATSLGFTGNLREVSVYFNERRVINLCKKMSEPRKMNIISGLNTYSPKKMFQLRSVDMRNVQLDVEKLVVEPKAKTINDCQTEVSSIFLRIANGNLDVRVSKEFSAEMERSTKKKPPSKTVIQMLFTGFDESSANYTNYRKNVAEIFKDLLPYPDQGRIFIGFPTHQTTGCASHLAARVIPTVERESVDLVDKTLAVYNEEMLTLAGILSRLLYEDEMSQVSRMYNEMLGSVSKPEDEVTTKAREWLQNRAIHALNHFSFKQSTPNYRVGRIIETTFFQCSTQPLSILSTVGVKPISAVRLPVPEIDPFIKSVPTVPKPVLSQCDVFFKKAKEQLDMIKELSIADVFLELRSRILSEEEMVALMKWWISYCSKVNLIEDNLRQLLRLAKVRTSPSTVAPLEEFHYFLNPRLVPPDVDLPPDVLPYSITKSFPKNNLEKWFRVFTELQQVTWVAHVVTKPEIENSPQYAEKILAIISRSWSGLNVNDQNLIQKSLSQKRCIPSKYGMMLIPDQTYFPNVNLFQDLPIINFSSPKAVSEKFLLQLGVRKHVELQLVFDRLISQGSWDHMQLVKYLASVELKPIEKDRLKITPIWPREQPKATATENNPRSIKRCLTSELYAPINDLRELGLPIIEWKGKWHSNMNEAKFLFGLGLRTSPPLQTILTLAAPPTAPELRKKALHYFLEGFKDKYKLEYNAPNINIAFLPCTDKEYARPVDCFSSPSCSVMGFRVLHQDLRFRSHELGVAEHPSRAQLLERLTKEPPKTEEKAKEIFEYLAGRQGDFVKNDWIRLGELSFIPVACDGTFFSVNPLNCFFRGQDDSYKEFFTYVDFGERANTFLRSCGVKSEPSPTECAQLLVRSSHELLNNNDKNVEKYLKILRIIAVNFHTIQANTTLVNEMKRRPILLGSKKQNDGKSNDIGEDDRPDDDIVHYQLAAAKDIFINDNPAHQRVFNPLIAPTEEYLEILYENLGCQRLNNNVRESYTPKGQETVTPKSRNLEGIIKERAPLFFHEKKGEASRDAEWLQNKLKIREVREIEISLTLIPTKERRVEPATSCIILDRSGGGGTLYISGEIDYLDIGSLLSKQLYKKPKWQDALLLNSVLTTSLPSLKRKGYPVDRILKAKRPATEKYMIDKTKSPASLDDISSPPIPSSLTTLLKPRESKALSQLEEIFPDCDTEHLRRCIAQEKTDHVQRVTEKLITSDYPRKQGLKPGGVFDKFENSKQRKPVPVSPESTVQLRNALRSAVQQCRPNSGLSINSQQTVTTVSESQTSYCDVIPGHSLTYVGLNNGIEIYASKDVDGLQLMNAPDVNKQLNRFVLLLRDLCDVFQLQSKAVHVYYDTEGPTVAFNRDSSLFFNLRYYIGLHNTGISERPKSEAFVYWFMTFCHELAHNFIKPHNSEHEYYFSSFAESYMTNFIQKLKQRSLI